MVCKLWKNIITSREFSKAHFKKWQYSNHSIAEIIVSQVTPNYNYDFASMDITGSNTLNQLSLTAFVKQEEVRVLDSLDGLLLFYVPEFGKNELYVCNPLTRRLAKLEFLIPSFWQSDRAVLHFKLVFDSALSKYKVLGFCCKDYKIIERNFCALILNSIEEEGKMTTTPIWREMEYAFRLYEFNPIVVNGSLYWIAHTIAEDDHITEAYIESMEIVSEELMKGMIELPTKPQNKYWGNCRLLHIELVKETLCVAIPHSHTDLGIWVLEDWDKHVWTNVHNIEIKHSVGDLTSFVNCMFHILFVTGEDDEHHNDYSEDIIKLIVRVSGNLYSYSPKTGLLTEITTRSAYFAYVPTLNTWD